LYSDANLNGCLLLTRPHSQKKAAALCVKTCTKQKNTKLKEMQWKELVAFTLIDVIVISANAFSRLNRVRSNWPNIGLLGWQDIELTKNQSV